MKKLLIASLCFISILFIGCDTTSEQINKDPLAFSSPVNDIFYKEPTTIPEMNAILKKAEKIKQSIPKDVQENNENNQLQINNENDQLQTPVEEEANENFEVPVVEEEYENIEESPEEINEDGLTAQSGVNFYNGRTETYYSSNSLYHQDTDQWTVDDEGFYRTDEGYYVVAASDMPQGTTFEGSKGTCIVLDSGCEEGVTDYYTNF
jgi:hypothetical protein